MLAIVLVALTASACSVSRQATTAVKSEELKVKSEVRDSSRVEQVMVAVHDTLTITKTITITENEQGDTVRLVQVTDRDRVRDRAAVKDREEKVMVKTDTVYIERKDSVRVQEFQGSSFQAKYRPAWVQGLKWIFWIVIAVTVLVVVIKFSRVFRV